MDSTKIRKFDERYEDYLHDESKLCGSADSISFPESEQEVADILHELPSEGLPVTIQGGRTGIVGGAVPMGGHVMNLSRLSRLISLQQEPPGSLVLTAEAGMTVSALEQIIREKAPGYFFPSAPSEGGAAIGGLVATKARGARALLYGGCENYIVGLRYVDGEGQARSTAQGDVALEQLLGSEGELSAITQVSLRLVKKPACIWQIVFFFRDECCATDFIDSAAYAALDGTAVAALEFMDRATIDLIERYKPAMSKIQNLPAIPAQYAALATVELHGSDEEAVETAAELLMGLAENNNSDVEAAWALSGEREAAKITDYRHAAAEACNMRIAENKLRCGQITKLGVDMATPSLNCQDLLRRYRADSVTCGVPVCIFGHRDNLHMNFIPDDSESYSKCGSIMRVLASECLDAGGRPVCEHGAGRIKRRLYAGLGGSWSSDNTREKKLFDPQCIFGGKNC